MSSTRANCIAALCVAGFVGACVAIALFFAGFMHQQGFHWIPSVLLGAATGVVTTWLSVWLVLVVALRLARAVRALKKTS
jgi:hypothetical protein